MSNITHIGDIKKDGTLYTPEQTLQYAIDDIGKNGALKNAKKLLVLCLDDMDNGYSVSWYQCGMKMSECLALCDIGKTKFKEEMEY
jgi:hypothetical protein